jgi:hypothetical protein
VAVSAARRTLRRSCGDRAARGDALSAAGESPLEPIHHDDRQPSPARRARRARQYLILDGPAPIAGPPPSPSLDALARREEAALRQFGRARHALIAEAAYYRSLLRRPGGPDADRDWFEAELEIDALLDRPDAR